MLVTGFETYCKRRFIEIEDEGIHPDFDGLVAKLTKSPMEREAIVQESTSKGISPTCELAEERIDFQNYDRCKVAFNKGYGIKFGQDLSVSNTLLEEIQRLIKFRHRIVHISPLLNVLNDPIAPNRDYAEKAIKTFNDFIQGLHAATLRLHTSRETTTPIG